MKNNPDEKQFEIIKTEIKLFLTDETHILDDQSINKIDQLTDNIKK